MSLLNRALNKLTGRRKLNLDKDHGRYYFEPEKDGKAFTVRYRSLAGIWSERNAAWRPTFRHNKEYKNYWEHLAVNLRFHRVDAQSWCLSIRPERRFTRDGYEPLPSEKMTKRSSSRHSRRYNIDVLTEVQFWREYLSNGSPRILMHFSSQSLIVENQMVSTNIFWPGVPDDAKSVKNIIPDEDLFSWAELDAALGSEDSEDEFEDDNFEKEEDWES
jgi:hypothetical protein